MRIHLKRALLEVRLLWRGGIGWGCPGFDSSLSKPSEFSPSSEEGLSGPTCEQKWPWFFIHSIHISQKERFSSEKGKREGGEEYRSAFCERERRDFPLCAKAPPYAKIWKGGSWSYYVCAQSPTPRFSSFPHSTRKGFFVKGTVVGRTILCPSSEYESKRIGDDTHSPPLYGAPSLLFLHRIQGGGLAWWTLSSLLLHRNMISVAAPLFCGEEEEGKLCLSFPCLFLFPLPSIHMLIFATRLDLGQKGPPLTPQRFPPPFCWGDFFSEMGKLPWT